jgi:hypothetical protein
MINIPVRIINKKQEAKTTRIKKDKRGDSYHIDLRQDDAWGYYIDRRSETYNNAKKSAMKAGYTEKTASRITSENWWNKKVELLRALLPKAEEIFLEDLNMNTMKTVFVKKIGDDEDEAYQEVQVIDPQLRRIRSDTAMFIGETVGRKMYHKKLEVDNNINSSLVEGNPLIDNLFRKKVSISQ